MLRSAWKYLEIFDSRIQLVHNSLTPATYGTSAVAIQAFPFPSQDMIEKSCYWLAGGPESIRPLPVSLIAGAGLLIAAIKF
jgi:hypothetical protein